MNVFFIIINNVAIKLGVAVIVRFDLIVRIDLRISGAVAELRGEKKSSPGIIHRLPSQTS
jgi:hypothetical protein